MLGPFCVTVDGADVVVTSVRQRTLLAVLVVARGSVVSAERLADVLWGVAQPQDPHQALQTQVSRVRGLLARAAGQGGQGLLVTRPTGYALVAEADQVDAWWFERLAVQAKAASLPVDVLERADRGLALWRGPPLEEFEQGVARREAMRLEELRLGLVERRAEALFALGRSEELVADLEPLVSEHPLREQLHGCLMLALYRCGRQAEALGVYRVLRDRLVDELGVEPSPALRHLERGILRERQDLVWPSTSTLAFQSGSDGGSGDERSVSEAGVQVLPVEVTSFVGRRGAVESVGAALRRSRLVTLTGVGGVGKTRLALRVAREVATRVSDGVRLCDLAGVADPAAVPGVVAAVLGVQPRNSATVEDAVVAALRSQRALLVLDNCEHVLDGVCGLVQRIVAECPDVGVLATSRQPLGVAGEQVWPVEPLDATAADEATAPAVELFLDRAGAADPWWVPTDDEGGVVAEICRRLDGLPLAIELAAARVRSMTPADIAARLDRRFALLTRESPATEPRHRSLQAVVDVSYALLSEPARRLFDRLAVFAGGFTLEAAEHVCVDDALTQEEVAVRLGELVDHSLVVVERSGAQARYRLLETLRVYGATRLSERGELARWRRRHAEHFLELAEQADVAVRGPEEARSVAVLDAELDNLRGAYGWAVDGEHVDLALRLPAALGTYAYFRLRDEVFGWAQRAVELPAASAGPSYASALVVAGVGLVHRGALQTADSYARQALRTTQGTDERAALRAHQLLADIAIFRGWLDALDQHGQQLAEDARKLASPYDEAFGHLYRAFAAVYSGRRDAALAEIAELQKLAESIGNPTLCASFCFLEGECQLDDDPDRASAALEQAIAIAESVDNRFVGGVARVSVASLQARHGEGDRALDAFREIVDHWRATGGWTHQWVTLRNLVVLFQRLRAEEAAAVLHGAIETATTGAEAFGADAERQEAIAASLRTSLGEQNFAIAEARGRDMTDDEAVAYALGEIDRLRADRPAAS